MRLISCLFVFMAVNLLAQEQISWPQHELTKFKASLIFPGATLEVEDDFGDLYAKYEVAEGTDSLSHSTYKILAIHHRGFYEKRMDESFYKDLVKEWAIAAEQEIVRSEFLEWNGINVMRGVVKDKLQETKFSAWQMTKVGGNVYLQTVSHERGDFIKADLVRFFESLDIEDEGNPEMHQFSNKGAAVSFETPVKPQLRRQTRVREEFGDERPLHIYSFVARDKLERFNYLMVYRNNPAGIVFEDMDADFLEFQKIYEKAFNAKAKNVKRVMFKGYPASELNFDLELGSKVHMLIVVRGNKLYMFMIEEVKGGKDFGDKKTAFHDSIKFLPLEYTTLKASEIEEDYTFDFPSRVGREVETFYGFPFESSVDYFSLDTLSGVSYNVTNYKLSPFYSVENYDSLLRADADTLKAMKNLMSFKDTVFQQGKAWHIKRFSSDSDMVINDLMFYRGPHYFELMVCGSSETPDSMVWDFFNSFEMKVEEYTDDYIRKDKSDALWTALESRDSATLFAAKSAFQNIDFKTKDLPKIYKLLERNYDYDTLGYRRLDKLLFDELESINDETTIPFLQKIFDENIDNPSFQKDVLGALVSLKSKEAIRLFFDYAKTFDLENANDFGYRNTFYPFRDSLQLAAVYTSDLMSLVDHQAMDYQAMQVLKLLYQDTSIIVHTPESWKTKLLEKGRKIIVDHELLTKDTINLEGSIYQMPLINELLSFIGSSEAVEKFITDQFRISDQHFKTNIIKTAFVLDVPVPDSILTQMFESKIDGYDLLNELADDSLLKKIPRHLYNQDYVVEGLFTRDANYDYGDINDFQIFEKRNIIRNGEKYILHIVQFNIEEYKIPQVGICTQPSDETSVSIWPDYFTYDDWDKEEGSRPDYVKGLIKDFVTVE